VAIVTGAGQGIGRGIALALAREAVDLVIVGRTEEKLQDAAAELERAGASVRTVQGGIEDRETADRAVDEAVSAFGALHILVNNAHSFTTPTTLEDLPEEWFRTNMDTGFFGTLHFMQAAFPRMRERGGSIINFGSYAGTHSSPGYAAYASTKEAIRALSRVASRDWGRYGIRVNVINPAATSPAAERAFARSPGYEEEVLKSISLGYLGDPEADIGRIAVFLAGDDARYVTGQTINADGGRWMF
jgi:NAD(P)-dependent dehydrogenase (short-subunit alcohol dehydrogenase family)